MSGPKRNPDSMNTIGIVVVGICGAVMVYVTITALQAFYMNDTSEIQTMADYGGQDTTAKSHKAAELSHITTPEIGTQGVPIDRAIDLVVAGGKDPSHLVPAVQTPGWHPMGTEVPHPGAPEIIPTAVPAAGAGSGMGSGAGSDAAPAVTGHTTGSPADGTHGGVGGGGGAPAGKNEGSAALAPGGHAR
jgi:hypothetical protein